MQVSLEAIKFNHDQNSATEDALNIRKNENEPIHVPEWRRGISINPEDSPAAYARDALTRSPTIKAKFKLEGFDEGTQSIWIRAADGRLRAPKSSSGLSRFILGLFKPLRKYLLTPNVLGSVQAREIKVRGGEEYELFELANVGIVSAGVSASDIIWHWQWRTHSNDWTDFAETTHRVFTVLALPHAPWKPKSSDESNTQQPWSEVLDYACRWAAGASNAVKAAILVTRHVNGLGGVLLEYGKGRDRFVRNLLIYDAVNSGSTSFTLESPPMFDCTEFLKLLRTGFSKQGARVNCDDCAAFVVSFANILGCQLNEGRMGTAFDLNPHQRIGNTALDTGEFSHHTVAWTGASGEDDELFDACVQLDSDDEPANEPHPLMVPTNIRFGQLHEHEYRYKLAAKPKECNPLRMNIERTIGVIKSEQSESALTQIGDFFASLTVSDWTLSEYRPIHDSDSIFVQSFWNHATQADTALRVDFYWTQDNSEAEAKLDNLMKSFQLLKVVEQGDVHFGDKVEAVPSKFAIVFRRSSVVVRLRNIGVKLASSESLARAIDTLIIRTLGKSASNQTIFG